MACKVGLHGNMLNDRGIVFSASLLYAPHLPSRFSSSPSFMSQSSNETNADLMRIHMSIISILGLIGVIVTTFPLFQGPKYRVHRAGNIKNKRSREIILTFHHSVLHCFWAVYFSTATSYRTLSSLPFLFYIDLSFLFFFLQVYLTGFSYIWPLLWRLTVMGGLCIFGNNIHQREI